MEQKELNEQLKQFLVDAREKAGLSQSDVAARSTVFGMEKTLDQRAVSRIEKQPISVDAIKMAGYLSAVGVPLQRYYELLTELTSLKDTFTMNHDKINTLANNISAALSKVESIQEHISSFNHDYINSTSLLSQIEDISGLIKGLNRKPVIGFFGHFDAGKSTLLNTIIEDPILPAQYQPATCIVNLLMHKSDRPDYLHSDVALFKKGFKPHMINTPDLVQEYLLCEGNYDDLNEYGLHNHDGEAQKEAYIAVVFCNAEILRSVWLLDTPGDLNSSDDSDTEMALGGVELVDGVVYLSNAAGFLKETDLGFAQDIIRHKPPVDKNSAVDHLLFVQSHCHSALQKEDIAAIAETSFKRTKRQFDELIFNTWLDDGFIDTVPEAHELSARCVPFWRENDEYRLEVIRRVLEMSDHLNHHFAEIVDTNIKQMLERVVSLIEATIDNLNSKKTETTERIKEVEKEEARFRDASSELIAQFQSLIKDCAKKQKSDTEQMMDFLKAKSDVSALEDTIKELYDNKKEAQDNLGSYIGQLMSSKLESILKTSGKHMSTEIDLLLEKWQKAAPSISGVSFDSSVNSGEFDVSDFNSRAAFVGGFAGLGSLGAMALYVSTISSNLGAYILVGKAAGVLTSLGLVGSVTSVTSFVAAIGGPITIGIALAAAIGYLVYRLFGGSWEGALAKKASEELQKQSIAEEITSIIKKYWDSTASAIEAGLDELISESEKYLKTVKIQAQTEYNTDELEACIDTLSTAKESLR